MKTDKVELRNFFNALNAVLLVAITWMVLYFTKELPDKIPLQFGLDGTPNRWSGKGDLIIILAAVLGINAFFYLFAAAVPWLRKHPALLNIPNKKRFLALPLEKQRVYWDLLKEFMAGMAVSMNILFLTAIWGTIRVGLGEAEKLPGWSIWPGTILVFVVVIIYIPRMIMMPKKLLKD
ncbi:MAG: DUF1648 domain-containing protein [bacterium]|nr:DUF1648 domain-containing protein [bacterium]